MSRVARQQGDWAREALAFIGSAIPGRIVDVTFRATLDPLRQDVVVRLDEPFELEDLRHVRTILRAHADRDGRHVRRVENGNPMVVVAMRRTNDGSEPEFLRRAKSAASGA